MLTKFLALKELDTKEVVYAVGEDAAHCRACRAEQSTPTKEGRKEGRVTFLHSVSLE
jgi:hypothetical protein